MGVKVRIEEVVLHGFDPRDRHAIGDVLREELAQLLTGAHFAPFHAQRVNAEVQGSVRDVDTVRAIANVVKDEVTR